MLSATYFKVPTQPIGLERFQYQQTFFPKHKTYYDINVQTDTSATDQRKN